MPKLKFKTDKMFTDITDQIEAIIPKKFEGLVNVYSPHTTCCVWQTENEILHLVDVRFFLDKQVPYVKQPEGEHRNVKYLHDMMSLRPEVPVNEKINGHSHIRSMFLRGRRAEVLKRSDCFVFETLRNPRPILESGGEAASDGGVGVLDVFRTFVPPSDSYFRLDLTGETYFFLQKEIQVRK